MSTKKRGSQTQWGWLLFIGISLVLVIHFSRGILDLYKVRERITQAEEQVAALEEEKSSLEQDYFWRMSDVFQEREIRDKLRMSKPGEVVVVIPEEDLNRPIRLEEESSREVRLRPNWQKWVDVLLKR